jgi:hypothetical protein
MYVFVADNPNRVPPEEWLVQKPDEAWQGYQHRYCVLCDKYADDKQSLTDWNVWYHCHGEPESTFNAKDHNKKLEYYDYWREQVIEKRDRYHPGNPGRPPQFPFSC